jgi:type IV pilus assembly protein PilY1
MPYQYKTLTRFLLLAISWLVLANGRADDIEVYLQPPVDPVPPNILFVLDESGSMSDPVGEGGGSRRDALVNALRELVESDLLDNVNAALLGYTTRSFDLHQGLRLDPLTGDFTVVGDDRSEFLNEIEALNTLYFTPTTDALAAAVDWFHPDRAPTQIHHGHSLASPLSGDPETQMCAPNRIILLSDGAPNTTNRTEYEGIPCAEVNLFDDYNDGQLPPSAYNMGARCANEIAAWAYQTDLATGAGWEGVQNIETYTVSFGTQEGSATQNFMDGIASESGGNSWNVATENELREAFEWVIVDAQGSIDYAMNTPTIPFNQDNAAVSGDYIYVPLFYPEARELWRGNLKKYTLDVSDNEIELRAQGGQSVLDDDHNFNSTVDLFCQGACESDEGDPLIGGAARNMTGERTLFTNLNPEAPLSDPSNRIHASNTTITPDLVGAADEDLRTTLLQWISRDPGYVATETHPARVGEMGAPIHTRPEVVRYGDESIVYLPTSEGVLEAIDADTGEEIWAFMPQELMANINRLRNNDPSDTPYYGLDGPLTIYETGNRKIAIVGMRRGGEKYYMLDITHRLEPEFISEISRESPGRFDQLGQTWSKPLFARMRINGTEQDVLIFGGGYDPDQDNNTGADDQGNAIFVVDAADGSYLASISSSNANLIIAGMENAIPSDLATVDINSNGVVDRIYAADVGGKIIRVDFPDNEGEGNAISGGIVADINHPSQSTAHRKFFNTPQIGYYAKGTRQFLVLMIGTGDRANPLNTDVDRFYMIKDDDVWGHTMTANIAGEESQDFINATTTVLNNGGVLDDARRGWFMDLPAGEKSYSKAILYDYSIFFTTYHAERVTSEDPCLANSTSGTAKIYGLDLISANAAVNWNGITEGELTIADRSTELSLQGIPPSPMLVFPRGEDEHGNTTIGKKILLFADLEKKHEWGDRFRPIYWEEVIEE